MKTYIGERTPDGCQVVVVDSARPDASYLLPPRHDLRNHSPDGFNWSYSGSGPAQLSLALLADALGDDRRAERVYQRFKQRVISRLIGDHFTLTADEIRQTVTALEAERGWSR